MRFLLPVLFAACVPAGGPAGDDDPTARDLAQYDELADRLDHARTSFLGAEADELQAAAHRIFWLQYESFDPSIHSSLNGQRVDYAFPAGTDGNVRVSDTVLATATRDGDSVIFRAYAATQRAAPLGETSLPAPTDEQKWWAYAVDEHGDVYIVTTGDHTTLLKWTPGSQPTAVAILEEHGVNVGIFLDLAVVKNHCLFIESGRLWTMDLATKTATWVGNKKEITGAVSTDGLNILYVAADGPHYWAGGSTLDVRDEIARSGYRLNDTFASIHEYAESGVLHAGNIVYKGQAGVFAYSIAKHEVTPLLLEPRSTGKRIVYTDPQITDAGTLYITGLESDSGSVGADGPVYSLDLTAALR